MINVSDCLSTLWNSRLGCSLQLSSLPNRRCTVVWNTSITAINYCCLRITLKPCAVWLHSSSGAPHPPTMVVWYFQSRCVAGWPRFRTLKLSHLPDKKRIVKRSYPIRFSTYLWWCTPRVLSYWSWQHHLSLCSADSLAPKVALLVKGKVSTTLYQYSSFKKIITVLMSNNPSITSSDCYFFSFIRLVCL